MKYALGGSSLARKHHPAGDANDGPVPKGFEMDGLADEWDHEERSRLTCEGGSSSPMTDPRGVPEASGGRWPSLSLIVPVAGATRFTAECLGALLDQDYPAYEVVLVTRDRDDGAVPVVRELLGALRGGIRGRHVVSGVPRSCSQKNHSLIAGTREAGPVDVLVFADADHVPPRHWLRALVDPLARGEASVSTGYHRIEPREPGLVPTVHVLTVRVLSLAQHVPWASQPWGGSMAISRSLFEALDVAGLWARHMVDDVSLAALLRRRCLSVRAVTDAAAATPLGSETWTVWGRWLFRQILFLKFYFHGMWRALGIALGALAALSAAALALVLGLVHAPPAAVAAAWVHLGAVGAALVALRRGQPRREPLWRWILAGGLALFAACVVHGCTWFARSFTWRDLRYRVDRTGRVVDVRMVEAPPAIRGHPSPD